MRYSTLKGGKRIRPLLVYATGEALEVDLATLDAPACAVELIHSYSLIHDDLPSMDNDDLRRGHPTCHKAFDEATALLAGDSLQSLAFYILAHDPDSRVSDAVRLQMIEHLALASGSRGMAGGQAIDLQSVSKKLDIAELEYMHVLKTGALIRASVLLGALCGDNVPNDVLHHLDHYGKCIGLAFQIRDDVLDIEGSTETLGKHHGQDEVLDKPTYPAMLGLEGAKRRAHDLHEEAMESLSVLQGRGKHLQLISAYIVERQA